MSDPDNPERRRWPRTEILGKGSLRSGGREIGCRILNVSSSGVNVEIAGPIDLTAPVILAVDDHGEFPAEIVWRDGNVVGLMFVEEQPAVESLVAEAAPEGEDARARRQFTRRAVLWAAQIEFGGESADCTILNMSAGGAKLRVEADLTVGATLTLRTERFGDFSGVVRWQEGKKAGMQFSQEPKEVARLIGKALPEPRGDSDDSGGEADK